MKHFRVLLFLLSAALASGLAGCKPAVHLGVLGAAPSWKLKDLDGREISSDQFKGKVVVVDFWATWCEPCVSELPGYIALQKKYGGDGVAIVGISMDEKGADQVKQFAKEKGINYQIVMGDEAAMAAFGGVEVLPTTLLIDRAGQIRDRKVGIEDAADYARKVRSLLD